MVELQFFEVFVCYFSLLMVYLLYASIRLCCPWPFAGVYPATVWDPSCILSVGDRFFAWTFHSATWMTPW